MSKPDFPNAAPFDTGPLSWVMVEIREALSRSKTALFEAGGRSTEDQGTALQHAKSHLHQAHGALLMVDVDGVALLTLAAETALDRFKDGTLKCSADHAQTVANLYQALVEYLEELLGGAPSQPVRLFPYYQAVQQMLGAERIHPADLFYPDLAQLARMPAPVAADGGAANLAASRQRFEKALLPYLKSTDAPAQQAHAGALRDAIAEAADAQHEPKARTFWLAMQAFAELVASGQLAGSLYVKQLFGLINLQMRRLTQGNPAQPDAMLRDALFFIAGADTDEVSPLSQHLAHVFALDGMVPRDYETRRYGRIDLEALAAAKQGVADAKAAWERVSQADAEPRHDAAFGQALALVAVACDKLGIPALAALMRELATVAGAAVTAGRSDALDMEIATALLFAEHGVEQLRHLPDDFPAHADTIAARLQALLAGDAPPQAAQWRNGLAQQLQQDDTVVALAIEMKTGLRQLEKVLDEFHADPERRGQLAELDPVLHQLQGALAVLDQDDAMRAARHVQAEVARLARNEADGAAQPRMLDQIAQNVGALGFFVDMLAQNADGARERFAFDAKQGEFRAVPFKKIAAAVGAAPVPVLDEQVPPPAVPMPAPPTTPVPGAPAASGDDVAVEAELLAIFISEAQEVLAFVDTTLGQPDGQADSLTMLRRSFHTLKGSGRMVGLTPFADTAAAVERVMNTWLAEERPATPGLLALLTAAARELGAWVGELAAAGASARDGLALRAAATALLDDIAEGAEIAEIAETADTVTAAAPVETEAEVETETETEAAIEAEAHAEADTDAPAPAAAAPANGNVIEFPAATAPQAPPPDDHLKHIGELAIALPLYNIYLAETDELVRLLARDFGEWRHEPRRAVSDEALHAAHTLTGTSGTVGFHVLRDVAAALELTLQSLLPPAPQLDPAQHDLLDFAIERVRQMLQTFAQGAMPAPQPELVGALDKLRDALSAPRGDDLDARLDTLFAATFEQLVTGQPAADAPAQPADGQPDGQPNEQADDEADRPASDPLDALFAAAYRALSGAGTPASDFASRALPDAPKAPKAAAPSVNDDIDDLFDSAFDDAPKKPAAAADDDIDALFDHAFNDPFAEPLTQIAAPADAEEVAEPEPEAEAAPPAEPEPESEPDVEIVALAEAPDELLDTAPAGFHDELDADLLPVFLEEAADLLPQVGAALRAWHHEPSDFSHASLLQRVLHTVKGSARMAGAMRLGQHAHEIETHIENMVHAGSATPQAFDELLAHYDHALLLFEQLQHPAADLVVTDADGALAPDGEAPAGPARADGDGMEPGAARAPLVRVRADILDRLVNQAGEVSISRSRLENEVDALRTSLGDFGDNLTRLRRQLREIEMQAESQIASRMAISSEREFDPLEFDRFTRLQELTRMMAESVNDVASFQETLERSIDQASDGLTQQARITRDLQRDLMRVRMVPFSSIAERLFRVARLSAKELDKRVNLDVRGGAVEIDRSVLERMAAPFEHLLRNAIVHGVESRSARSAAGKSETGELLIEVSQQGNEVVIAFSDDGAGLDLERIRARAVSQGLLDDGDSVSDSDAVELIFEPGFSTADSLTELAGRGVGMDIVRSEALALGGRVDTDSVAGRGARFTIHLPLTLAVTQVVLLSAGGKHYALPSTLVEQLLQVKEGALGEAHAAGAMTVHGQQAALHYLPALLGDAAAAPPAQRSSPVLMLKSGQDRLALHVDDVLGNREVVIKNIGPQLARVAGIAGATVLGSGEIVLILNPVALAQRPRAASAPGIAATATAPVAAAARRTVMVVDDSLTVRKVTQRLLEREGYRVVLAKDGVDALEQMQDVRPDLMLVDIEMPRMDGFDLTRNVRGDEATRAIPIIMITSRSADKHRNYALQLGVNAYFGKPFQEAALLAAMDGLLAQPSPAS